MIEIEPANGRIISIAATTFWGADGRPMSARDFIECVFGDMPELFRDEDELRKLWSDPDTRKALLERQPCKTTTASAKNAEAALNLGSGLKNFRSLYFNDLPT
jgi:hypothetical protein